MKNISKRKGGELSRHENNTLSRVYKSIKATIQFFILALLQSSSGTLIQGKLGFKKELRDADFAVNAKAIYDALFLNIGGYYNPPFADLALLLDLINAFNVAVGNVKMRVLGAGGAKKTAKNDLYGCLKNALGYVNSVAWNRQSVAEQIITGAKLMLRANTNNRKQIMSAKYTLSVGEVLLQCLALKVDGKYYKASYIWQVSNDGGVTWNDLAITTESKFLVTGLIHGDVLKFRKRTVSTKFGKSGWCTAVDFTAN